MLDSFQNNQTGEVARVDIAPAVVGSPELLDPFYAQLRDQTRFWVQRVAVPCLTLVGLFGNAITIIIMTRRRMRSTTNMYLAALALVDMLYLVLTFLLGLSHYPNVATRRWYAYWRSRPFLMMLTDACSNTSVWLTVTFTIERFIAVKYPMKGKVWCTEARAMRLIVCVFVFGILFASPVPFEWEVKEAKAKGDAAANVRPNTNATIGQTTNGKIASTDGGEPRVAYSRPAPAVAAAAGGSLTGPSRLVDNNEIIRGPNLEPDWGQLTDDGRGVWDDLPNDPNKTSKSNSSRSANSDAHTEMARDSNCQVATRDECTLTLEYTEFGANETYKTIYYWSTAVIFCFVPLILLTLFNGFLIRSVHSSRRKRNLMTNTHTAGLQQQQQQQAAGSGVACQLQKKSHKLGRARLLIMKRYCHSTECKSDANGPPPPPSRVIIRSSWSGGSPDITAEFERPGSRHHAAGIRNSIIKFPPPPPNTGGRCSTSRTKVTFRQVGGNSRPAYDYRGDCDIARQFLVSGLESQPMSVMKKVRGATAGLAQASVLRHVDSTSTCNIDPTYDNQSATCRCLAEGALASAARVGLTQAQAYSEHGAHHCGACPPPPPGQCDSTIEGNPPARLDDIRDNKSKGVSCSVENLQQSKSTLARSKSAIGACASNGLFVANNNCFRLHQMSLTFGNEASRNAAARISNDARPPPPPSKQSDNGCSTTIQASALPPPHAAASSQERRITIMLIAVVILFLVCQIPSAGMLLYTSVHEPKSNSNEHALLLAFGNIFNFLMAVNAAGNFILYSFLSKKYRNTFVTTFCKCAWRRRAGGGRGPTKSRGYSSGGCDRQSTTTSQGRASRETSNTQQLVSSYQSTTTTTTTGACANSSVSSDDTTRFSSRASLVRFCRSVRSNAMGRSGGQGGGGGVARKAAMQPLESGQLGNGLPNLL